MLAGGRSYPPVQQKALSPCSLSALTLASSPAMVFMVVSTPRVPTTVVTPFCTSSLMKNSGVCVLKPVSPLPPSRCTCGSMSAGATMHPRASTTSYSAPSRSRAPRSISPTLPMCPSASSTCRTPHGSGAYTRPPSISVSIRPPFPLPRGERAALIHPRCRHLAGHLRGRARGPRGTGVRSGRSLPSVYVRFSVPGPLEARVHRVNLYASVPMIVASGLHARRARTFMPMRTAFPRSRTP